jgi:hypothetical protein
MADAAAPSEGAFVFDSSRLDVVAGDGKSLYVDFIVAPDRIVVAFRIRREGTDIERWQGAYECTAPSKIARRPRTRVPYPQ